MKKLPVLITYIKTTDDGNELRYALRSLSNIKNFNQNVTVVGDRVGWLNATHIPKKRLYGRIYEDQVVKIKHACRFMPDEFIIGMDDCYVTEPTEISYYCIGELESEAKSIHKRTKMYTREKLLSMGLPTKDYEAHSLFKVQKDKLLETLDVILADPHTQRLQWRSMYGNMHNPEYEMFEDKKTKTTQLKEGAIISTNFYTPELHRLFPEPSSFEVTL